MEDLMLAMGFSHHIVELIMRCVRTVRYLVQVNKRIGEYFTPSRGLQQGDPLSPYLFLLCTEGFGALIEEEIRTKALHGIQIIRNAPTLSHLFFVDDSLIFTRATETELRHLLGILETYHAASG